MSNDEQLLEQIKTSANKIWLAGLGAFAHANREGENGENLFETLVKEGEDLQNKSVESIKKVKDKASFEVHKRATDMKDLATGKIEEVKGFATDTSDRIQEKIDEVRNKTREQLETRIKSLRDNFSQNIQTDIDRLTKQVKDLSEAVRRVSPSQRNKSNTEESSSVTEEAKKDSP